MSKIKAFRKVLNKKKKIIKGSKRGLTFSMESEDFPVGSHFVYQVDTKRNQIIIRKSEEGLTVSKKKSGCKIRSLFDLRAKEIREKVSDCDYMEIVVGKDQIYISCKNKEGIIEIPKVLLATGTDGISDSITFGNTAGIQDTEKREIKGQLPEVIKCISLFSGAGMLDLPFARDPAFDIIYACEISQSACETYAHNIGSHIHCEDIRKVTSLPTCDVLFGGPSCKAYSNSNRRTRLADHGDINLIDEYIRIAKLVSPKVFLIENVPPFLTFMNGKNIKSIQKELPDYIITSKIIMDGDLNGYTKRKRAIVFGSKIGQIDIPDLHVSPYKCVKEALEKVNDTWPNYKDITVSKPITVKRMQHVPQGGNWKYIPDFDGNTTMHSDRYYRLNPDDLSPTIVNWRKLPLIHPWENRTLSVSEACSLSGLDANFRVYGSLDEKQTQIGNGVPYAIARFVKNLIKKAFTFLKDEYDPSSIFCEQFCN